ncbi:hypothetical protein [Caldalkalibacillus mannanilyticus]|nr:hypothetical protein [Caldalkalibacillus mannanilyticus]
MKKERQDNMKLSYESDGKMGKKTTKERDNKQPAKKEEPFFNTTQSSE